MRFTSSSASPTTALSILNLAESSSFETRRTRDAPQDEDSLFRVSPHPSRRVARATLLRMRTPCFGFHLILRRRRRRRLEG